MLRELYVEVIIDKDELQKRANWYVSNGYEHARGVCTAKLSEACGIEVDDTNKRFFYIDEEYVKFLHRRGNVNFIKKIIG